MLGVNGYNIKMGVSEIIWEVVEWIDVTQDRGQVAGCCEDGNEPSGSKKCGDFPNYEARFKSKFRFEIAVA